MQGVSTCARCERMHKAGGVCKVQVLVQGVQAVCMQGASVCVQDKTVHAGHVFAGDEYTCKAQVGAGGLRGAVSPARTAMPPQGTHWGTGVGALAAPEAMWGAMERGEGPPQAPCSREQGTRRSTVRGGRISLF